MSNIGSKRERFRIVRQSKTRRTDGGYDRTPTTIAEFWAHARPVAGTEAEQAGRKAGAITYVITTATRSDITTEDGLLWLTRSSKALNIREIRDAGARPMHIEIIAESGVTQ